MAIIQRTAHQIAEIFRKVADKIDNGTCGLKPNELNAIASTLIHVEITEEQACHILRCSRTTLSRWVREGKIPPPHKESGDKKYFWEDEIH